MSGVLRIISLTLLLLLVTLSSAIEYYCENDVAEDSFCMISSIEVSDGNPICRMQFPNQTDIQLQFAALRYLSPRLLYRMEVVERLDIFNSLVGKAFVKPELEYLRISGSKTFELEIDPALEYRLTELNLPANDLKQVPKHLKHLKNLTMLDLSGNGLEYVDMSSFDGLGSLATVQLNDNRIKAVFATGTVQLKALNYLTFSTNELSLLDISRWETPLLEKLYLANNKLERLDGLLEKFAGLQFVSLTDNPWDCDWQVQTKNALEERKISYLWFDCREQDLDSAGVSIEGLKQEKVLKELAKASIAEVARNATGGADVDFDDIVDELFCRIYGKQKEEVVKSDRDRPSNGVYYSAP